MARLRYLSGCTILILLVLAPTSLAQTSKGFVVGTITDPNGAAVPAATIKITNTATGVALNTAAVASWAGIYEAAFGSRARRGDLSTGILGGAIVSALAYVTDYGVQMASTAIATLPLLILGLVLGKQLVGGIMEGAVKG